MTFLEPASREIARFGEKRVAGLIVVPARFGSTRLPGKPLIKIAGHTLLERVYAIAQQASAIAGDCEVVIATDDDRIAEHASALGAEVAMTSASLNSGSERAFAAATQRTVAPELVINLQGDAPFIPPSIVADLVRTLRDGDSDVATPVYRLDWDRLDHLRRHKETAPFSGTICIRANDGRAIWFSKTIIPAIRDETKLRNEPFSPVWQHMGLYGYRLPALEWFASAGASYYEQVEGLEQLRFLESGRTVMTVEVGAPDYGPSGIDSPADVALAEAAIAQLGDPFVG